MTAEINHGEASRFQLLGAEAEDVVVPNLVVVGRIIERARQFHIDHPMDAAHDWRHHVDTSGDCLLIIVGEGLVDKCDLSVVLVSAVLHDATDNKRQAEEARENEALLRELIIDSGGGANFANKVIDTISAHSFRKDKEVQELSLEAQIVYDADKLQYVYWQRVADTLQALGSEQMNEGKLAGYVTMWVERIREVKDSLYFETSRRLFDERFGEMIEYVRREAPEYTEVVEGVV